MVEEKEKTLTVKVTHIPQKVTGKDIYNFFESLTGKGTVFACQIFTEHKDWKSRGHGRVQFETKEAKAQALSRFQDGRVVFKGCHRLVLLPSFDDIIARPLDPNHRFDFDNDRNCAAELHTGLLLEKDCMSVLESWELLRIWVMPERQCLEFWLKYSDGECYKLEIQFADVVESCGCSLDGNGELNAVLLQLKHAPKIYKKKSGPEVAGRFRSNRYQLCKEDFDFLWVRTSEFSDIKSIGHSSSLCWELDQETLDIDLSTCLPYFRKDVVQLTLEDGEEFCSASELVPFVRCPSDKLSYEVLYQLNSLVHLQKISFSAVNAELIELLSKLDSDTAMSMFNKLHKLQSTCYNPIQFIKMRLHVIAEPGRNLHSSSQNRTCEGNLMSCHRVLITPSKIYCLGPELESSNYIVKNFALYASDFLRVTFVEEDWGKLPSSAISTSIEQGIFARPYKTSIYHRILSVLKDGIVIGNKRFQFLAFSASQLRSNSVWMFASNEHVKAEDIRDWMGSFEKIRSVSKCAARMGQLFSSSMQTLEVRPRHVELIPDIEVTSDGVEYCFSDGIGKISAAFAKEVAQRCGLSYVPSAFQIRYGGYKGVVAVDSKSSHKLSLRRSMLKFESTNYMLNITKWSEAMPCYLNREIVTLLSTLGVKDEVFESLHNGQLGLLDKMLRDREAALEVLESMGMNDTKSILPKMLYQGYDPNIEPYLSMMLQSYRENLLSDIRSRSRIFVPRGRVVVGCLDERGILNYGQVYVRLTLKKAELKCGDQIFRKLDDTTAVVRGKVVVTKNPCLHPGDIRVLEAVYDVTLEKEGLTDCIVFPQKGERPHPNECSGGDLDGDLYFISWDENLIPSKTVAPMDYTGRRPRIMDHNVTLEEIQSFFVDYMINDTLGAISTAHLVHSDREPDKALSHNCLQLATLHSMAVDFAKAGAPAEMPQYLKPREYPDFMERWDKPMYTSRGVLGKLYRATITSKLNFVWSKRTLEGAYDHDLVEDGYEAFLAVAETHKQMYSDKMESLLIYYGAKTEDEILTGNLRHKSAYLQRDNRRYYEVKDRILVSAKTLYKEAKGWFHSSCQGTDRKKMASAWYHVTYHPTYSKGSANCWGFPWIVGDILLDIKSCKNKITE